MSIQRNILKNKTISIFLGNILKDFTVNNM